MNALQKLYSGKVKTIYQSEDPNCYVMEFSDQATAFNGTKKAMLSQKGAVNNSINTFVMDHLASQGIQTHFVRQLSETKSLVKKLEMIPVECVVRNLAAGSLCKRLKIPKAQVLEPPVFEFFYKSDALGDPLINESHIKTFSYASDDEMTFMREQTLRVNEILKALFQGVNLTLVDFKLEFGRLGDQIVLGDEITPDGCRIWDAQTQEILDKDRFRQDLGEVIESYISIADRLGVAVVAPHSS